MSNADPFHVRYRPHALKEVFGQKDAVASLTAIVRGKTRPHSFLFTGPSGCGKTTLARILASEFDCDQSNIIEADAATNNGIDDMRGITETLRYTGFGESPNKMIIIDECFSPETLVFTPTGQRKLGSLIPGDQVIGAYGTDTVRRVIKTQVDLSRIVKVLLPNDQVILTSEDHPFLTSQGWVQAKEIGNVK